MEVMAVGKLLDEYGRIISVDFEQQFKNLVPRVRRAKKRLKAAKPGTKQWHKEQYRLNYLIANASYLQLEEPIK